MTEKNEKTEVHEGSVVHSGGIIKPEKRNMEETGVEPQDANDALTLCKNGACKMEIMVGVIKCPYCNHKQ